MVPEKIFSRISKKFQADPSLSGLFGSYDKVPFEQDFISQYRNLLHHFTHQNSNLEASTFWTGCGAIRKKDFDAVGGFDFQKYRLPSIEDIELGYRLNEKGYKINLIKELQVKHLKKWKFVDLVKVDFLHRAFPWSELIISRRKISNDLNTKNKDKVSVLLVFLTIFSLFFILDFWLLTLILFLSLLLLNIKLYQFFKKEKGLLFSLRVIPFQILFYLISGAAFGLAFMKFLISGKR